MIVFDIILMLFIADLTAGIFHYLQDTFGNPEWENSPSKLKYWIYINIIHDNILHHKQPGAFLKGNFFYRNWTTAVPSLILAVIAYFSIPTFWPLWGGFLIMSMANQVHCWAHCKAPLPIRILQWCYVLQSPQQHKIHHTRPFDKNFLVIFPWFNPLLRCFFFWEIVGYLIWLFTGVLPLEIRKVD